MIKKMRMPVSLGISGNFDSVNEIILEKVVGIRKNEIFARFDIILKFIE